MGIIIISSSLQSYAPPSRPLPATVSERTIKSKVARVKSVVRCSMTGDHPEHLVFVSAEQDIAGSLGLTSLEDIFKMQGPSGERRVKL